MEIAQLPSTTAARPSAPSLHESVSSAYPPLSVLTAAHHTKAMNYASFSITVELRTFHHCRTTSNPMGVRSPMWKSCNVCFVVQHRTATSTMPTSRRASWNCAIRPTLLAAHQPKHCLVTSFAPGCLFATRALHLSGLPPGITLISAPPTAATPPSGGTLVAATLWALWTLALPFSFASKTRNRSCGTGSLLSSLGQHHVMIFLLNHCSNKNMTLEKHQKTRKDMQGHGRKALFWSIRKMATCCVA